MKKKLALLLSLCIIMVVLVSNVYADSYQFYQSPKEYAEKAGEAIVGYSQAPELKDLVQNGDLPSIEERVPEEPLVIEPVESIGKYGGSWRRAWTGPADQWGLHKAIGERFLYWNAEGEIVPNVPKKWEVKDEGKTVVFYLRKGMKWSDGDSFNADDMIFYYQDIISNSEITPAPPGWSQAVTAFEKIDDYTVQISFSTPQVSSFLSYLATAGPTRLIAPAHYLKQFHPNYTSEEKLEDLTESEGFDDWSQLFTAKNDYIKNIERPVIFAWVPATDPSSQLYEMKRNPYYWKVDTEGNQLPYIDKIDNVLVGDPAVIVMRALSGEIDFQFRHFKLSDYPILKENEDRGNYQTKLVSSEIGAVAMITLNQNVKNSVKREIFQNKEFRHALSLAINREEINQMNYLGLGESRQASFISASPFFSEKWEKAYADYDPERANQILDELGYERGEDGFRIGPDGKKIVITVEYTGESQTPDLELIKDYFENIGIDLILKLQERSLNETRLNAGEQEASTWGFTRSIRPDLASRNINWTLTDGATASEWGPKWQLYKNTNGKEGTPYPEPIEKLLDIRDKLETTTDFEERKQLMQKAVNIHAEQIYQIGTVGEIPQVGIINENLKNFTGEGFVYTGLFRSPGNAIPQQFYYED